MKMNNRTVSVVGALFYFLAAESILAEKLNRRDELFTLLNEITRSECVGGTCRQVLEDDWRIKLRKASRLMISEQVSDGDAIGGMDHLLGLVALDVDLAKEVILGIGGVAASRPGFRCQEAAIKALIAIVQGKNKRPRSKSDRTEMQAADHPNPDVLLESDYHAKRGYYVPARMAIKELEVICDNNIENDNLLDVVINALEYTAIYDTSREISAAAKDFLDSKFPGYGKWVDCQRARGVTLPKDSDSKELCEDFENAKSKSR